MPLKCEDDRGSASPPHTAVSSGRPDHPSETIGCQVIGVACMTVACSWSSSAARSAGSCARNPAACRQGKSGRHEHDRTEDGGEHATPPEQSAGESNPDLEDSRRTDSASPAAAASGPHGPWGVVPFPGMGSMRMFRLSSAGVCVSGPRFSAVLSLRSSLRSARPSFPPRTTSATTRTTTKNTPKATQILMPQYRRQVLQTQQKYSPELSSPTSPR
jgi:hypothetical protein